MKNLSIFLFIFSMAFFLYSCAMEVVGPEVNKNDQNSIVPADTNRFDFNTFTLKRHQRPMVKRVFTLSDSLEYKLYVRTQVDAKGASGNRFESWMARIYQYDPGQLDEKGSLLFLTGIFFDPGDDTPEPINGENEVRLPLSYLGLFTGSVLVEFIHMAPESDRHENSIKFISAYYSVN